MNITALILTAVVVSVTGLLIGLLLGVAAKKFEVEVDEREVLVREELPGNNCGGCGYAGCDGLAKAIAKGEAPVSGCPVGGDVVAAKIGEIMGVSADAGEKQVAFVKCAGTCEKANSKFNYYGVQDCNQAVMIPGQGDKGCSYGCLGLGSCVKACPFDAIHIVEGIAKVDKEKCKACGKCVAICPKHLIEFIPEKATQIVRCSSLEKGKDVKAVCEAGCIGCGMCTRQCEFDAVKVENNLAYIDQSKCTHCGKCAAKCPTKVIQNQL
ncbi:electron transport complex protein RnfB [Lachnospiraceae bacterium KM106-2]|nr:electron transport complex protein RnfB [Lachnospiraceae bacterium KM106-2]